MSDIEGLSSEIVEAGGCRRRLTLVVPADAVAAEFDATLRRYARAVRLPGFRKGKAPPEMIRRRFAGELEEEVRDHLVRAALSAGLERHGASPVHRPVIEAGEPKQGEPYSFSALFEVKPEITLAEYRGLSTRLPRTEPTDEDVDRALDSLRERLATFVPVEGRAAARGDWVLVDLEGRFEEGQGEPFKREGLMIESGSANNLAEFNAALEGIGAGESRSFDLPYPADFEAPHLAGRTVHYLLKAREIKRKELPAPDDELVRDLGQEGTIADLKGRLREDLAAGQRRRAEQEAKEAIFQQLVTLHPLEVPEVLVEEELDRRLEGIVRGMVARGIDPEKATLDWRKVREEQREPARRRVLGGLVLDAIAAREGITASEAEVRERILAEARETGRSAQELLRRLEEAGASQALNNQLVREKALDFVLAKATITP